METITCILILDTNGDHVYVPYNDYHTNPALGTVVLKEKAERWKPVVKEESNYWFIKTVKDTTAKKEKYFHAYGGYAGRSNPGTNPPSSTMTKAQIEEQMLKEQNEQRRKRENWLKERGK
jgi:hypothetical protein